MPSKHKWRCACLVSKKIGFDSLRRLFMNDQTEYRKRYTAKRMAQAFSYLGDKCVKCGASDRLEFDHVDPKIKEIEITTAVMVKCWSWDRLVPELDKCQLLCHDCHHRKSLEAMEYGPQVPHGTHWRYRRWKCRCAPCVKANSETIAGWKK